MKVAVGVIRDQQQRVLITQRPLHVPSGGFWEFPGGKLEPGELASDALVREIKEEIDIDVVHYTFLGEINYTAPNKVLDLFVFHVTQFHGNPICREGQLNIKWEYLEHLNPADFPEANQQIFSLISCSPQISC